MNQWEQGRSGRKGGLVGAGHRAMAVIVAGACLGVAVIVTVLSFLSKS
jgi:hypothetical protein